MFRFCFKPFLNHSKTVFLFSCAVTLAVLVPATVQAQRSKGSTDRPDDNQPTFAEFRGIRIGMAADEARKKLGTPKEKSPEQDFYVFNDSEAVMINYDKSGAVSSISVDFMSGSNSVPTVKDVFGAEAEAKTDGSIYKMVRYPKAGYWVSYSRTAGNDPTITITMQKFQ